MDHWRGIYLQTFDDNLQVCANGSVILIMKYLILIFLALVQPLGLSAAETFPEWDKTLPQLVLTNVDLSADSLSKTLIDIGQYLGIRTVTYVTSDIYKAFAFKSP